MLAASGAGDRICSAEINRKFSRSIDLDATWAPRFFAPVFFPPTGPRRYAADTKPDVVRLARELEDLIRDADGERALVQRADRTTPKRQSGLALALAQPRACAARLAPPWGLLAILSLGILFWTAPSWRSKAERDEPRGRAREPCGLNPS